MTTNGDLSKPAKMLDFNAPCITALIEQRCWRDLPEQDRIGAVCDFVRNEIAFGYNRADDVPASEVLAGGFARVRVLRAGRMTLRTSASRSHAEAADAA